MKEHRRILLVDDEEVIRFGFSQVLGGPGVTVDSVGTAEEAFRLIEQNTYDGAVVDLRLSNAKELEGLEVAARIKSTQSACVVVILTAYGGEDTRQCAVASGADYFLEKPVEPNEIGELLRSRNAL